MNKNSGNVGVHFLTQKKFDKNYYLNLLNKSLLKEVITPENTFVLKEIIDDIQNDKYSFNTQEMTFIENYPEKLIEYAVFRYKFRIYSQKQILPNFPLYLLIEPTSICNLRCKMCFQIDKFFSEKEKMGFIDFDFYKSIIDQAVEGGTKAITMASRGEPLLNKRFPEMLDYAGGKFFELKVNTNCMLLNEEMSHKLLENDITDLVFSIDSAEKEQYENIRIGANFDRVLENIKNFNKIREKHYPNSKIVTRISGVKMSSEQDLEKFTSFWSNFVDEVAYVGCINRKDSYNNQETNRLTPCQILWNRMYVWWDGTCNPCDFDYKSSLALGNAKEKSLKEIWNGQKMQELRNSHANNKRTQNHPCNVCNFY